jgi:uncharacterized membrane protein YhaH (DUF805 family)
MSYLFSFKGRINRAKIWLFLLICIVVDFAIMAIAAFGFDWSATLQSFVAAVKATAPYKELDLSNLAGPRMAGPQSYAALAAMALLYVTCLYAGIAIFVKRLHDRNKSAWWLIPYYAVPMALQGYSYASAPSLWDAVMGYRTTIGYAADGIAALIFLWVFVELYFFRGTAAENRYGADPLGRRSAEG